MQDSSGTILIGYDGSEDAENAIRCAGELLALAEEHGATAIVVGSRGLGG